MLNEVRFNYDEMTHADEQTQAIKRIFIHLFICTIPPEFSPSFILLLIYLLHAQQIRASPGRVAAVHFMPPPAQQFARRLYVIRTRDRALLCQTLRSVVKELEPHNASYFFVLWEPSGLRSRQ
jgi:hypothetical protein